MSFFTIVMFGLICFSFGYFLRVVMEIWSEAKRTLEQTLEIAVKKTCALVRGDFCISIERKGNVVKIDAGDLK